METNEDLKMNSMDEDKKVIEAHLKRLVESDELKGKLLLARDITIKTEKVCTILWNLLPGPEECCDELCDCMSDYKDFREEIMEDAREKISELSGHIARGLYTYEELKTLLEAYEKENKRIEDEE